MGKFLIPGIVATVVGAILIIIGISVFVAIGDMVDAAIRKKMTIDSADHEDYNDWVSPYDTDDAEELRKIHIFNLTNPVQFKAGTEKPVYEDLGPYVYQYFMEKSNTSFIDDGSRVNFKGKEKWVFRPDLSAFPDDTSQYIVNINPFYLAFLNQIGGEANVPFVFASAVHVQFLQANLGGAWGTNNALCLPTTPTICGLNAFTTSAFGSAITMSEAQSAALLTTLADPMLLGLVGTVLLTILDPTAPAQMKAGALAQYAGSGVNASWGAAVNIENPLHAGMLGAYIQSTAANAFAYINGLVGGKYGLLFRESSPRDVIFQEDPLLKLMQNPGACWHCNETSKNYRVRTGSDDDSHANMDSYEVYESIETIVAYAQPKPMASRTRTMAPYQDDAPDTIEAYIAMVQRHFPGQKSGEESIKGIPTTLYKFGAEGILYSDPAYYNFIQGLLDGRPATGGIPVFVSFPHLKHAPAYFTDQLNGLDQSPGYESMLYVEKRTGLALKGQRQLQLNVMLNFTERNYSGVNIQNHPQIGRELMLPVFFEVEYAVISDGQAKLLKQALVDSKVLQAAILAVCIILGAGAIIVGILLIIKPGPTEDPVEEMPKKEADGSPSKYADNDETPKGNTEA